MYFFLVTIYVYTFLVKKICSTYCPPAATYRFFVFMKFNMRNGNHMDAHMICDLRVVQFVQVYF